MAIVWTKDWSAADDGTVLKAVDLKNIQDDINTTGIADASSIQGAPVPAPTTADDGDALVYDDASGAFIYSNLSGLPAGLGPFPWPTTTAPAGWILCYGQAINRTTYADLFAVIGTTFGVGDGSTTFNLPDMRGRGAIGLDNMGGVSADRVTDAAAENSGQYSGAEDTNTQHNHTVTTGGPSSTVFVDDNSGGTDYNVGSETHTHSGTTSNGGSTTQNVMNPYGAFSFIMKT
jgi:microcystin-dependent protein